MRGNDQMGPKPNLNLPCLVIISSSNLAEGEHAIMRNMNPLGKQSVTPNGTQSLTRDAIENAIKVRQWILDLMQAKTVRERSSFVQVSYC